MADRLDDDLARLSRELALVPPEKVSGDVQALVDQGLLDTDALFKLLERREETFSSPRESHARHFGRLAVDGGFVAQADVDAALKEQQVLAARGLRVQLGQILARNGRLKVNQILDILRRQDKHVIACPCGKRYLIENPRSDLVYQCGGCGRHLEPPDPTALAPGARVGRFEIESELGRGRTGIVYRAHDVALKRPVALKVLAGHDPDRFRREAAAIAKLRHPNIVNVQDAGEADKRQYVAMDLLEGQTLDRAGLDRRPFVDVLAQVARAIAHAHEQGIVHRDLRGRNVIVTRTRDGYWPFVLDFAVPPPGAPTDTQADHAALAAMLKDAAAGDRDLMELASRPPASAREFADALRAWLGGTRVHRR